MSPQNFSIPVAAEYGFFFVQSNPTELHYCLEIFSDTLPANAKDFDPSTINQDKHYEILECLKSGGIGDCVGFCEQWPYFGSEASQPDVDPVAPPISYPVPTETPKPSSAYSNGPMLFIDIAVVVLASIMIHV